MLRAPTSQCRRHVVQLKMQDGVGWLRVSFTAFC
jgi:hypothetical protein